MGRDTENDRKNEREKMSVWSHITVRRLNIFLFSRSRSLFYVYKWFCGISCYHNHTFAAEAATTTTTVAIAVEQPHSVHRNMIASLMRHHHIPIKNNQDQTKKNARNIPANINNIYPFQHEFTFYFHIYEEHIKIIYAVFCQCLYRNCVCVFFCLEPISLYACCICLCVCVFTIFVYHLFLPIIFGWYDSECVCVCVCIPMAECKCECEYDDACML